MVIQVASYCLRQEHLLLGQRARSYNRPTWEVFPSMSLKQPPGTSALIVCWEKADSVVFSKVGLMSIHLLLPSRELAWLLPWRDSTKKACRVTRNGWWVLFEFFGFRLILHNCWIELSAIAWLIRLSIRAFRLCLDRGFEEGVTEGRKINEETKEVNLASSVRSFLSCDPNTASSNSKTGIAFPVQVYVSHFCTGGA